ncbi:MAG TPA: hypothetical protein VFQ61_28235 [Polyangiaceae bacterium]|nr:hypothetical protein [Polyangiaceae bacterium]
MAIHRSVYRLSAIPILLWACSGSTSQAPTANPPTVEATAPEAPVSETKQTESAPLAPAPASEAKSAESAEKQAPAHSPLAQLMRDHFREAETIRFAVIAGKLEDAVQAAAKLSDKSDAGKYPKTYRTSLERMQHAAKRIQNSADIAEVTAAAADMGTACGSCHEGQHGPKANVGNAPSAGESVSSRMARHSWATARLWEGLYVPSSAAWNAGARSLQEDPFPEEVLKRGGVYARSAAKDFRTFAAQSLNKDSPTERATVYAALLRTCATCHLATRH